MNHFMKMWGIMKETLFECHGHLMMGGADYAASRAVHEKGPDRNVIYSELRALKEAGVTYFRDGGDALGVSRIGREMAGEYGIEMVTPIYAIHKTGYYGSIVGRGWRDLREFRTLTEGVKKAGGDFIKIMASGIITFKRYGELSCPGLEPEELKEMVRIAHGEGFRVMTHVNGPETVRFAAQAGVDSVEHGYFSDKAALEAMAEAGTVWVPTLAATEAFEGRPGFDRDTAERTVRVQEEALAAFSDMGGLIAAGSDSGAVGVPHGEGTRREYELLAEAGIGPEKIRAGNEAVRIRFRRGEVR